MWGPSFSTRWLAWTGGAILHFQTRTTIDTLDYSGSALNAGSKLVLAAAGPAVRQLPSTIPTDLNLPAGFAAPRVCLPGVLAVQGPAYQSEGAEALARFCGEQSVDGALSQFPWVVLVDDSDFAARNVENFVWVTFTRSDPAPDTDGIGAFVEDKHWGCRGALVTDARIKPRHAPPLIENPDVTRRVDARAARGGLLAKYL